MNKKQIEILFNLYEKLESDNELFNSFLEIIKIENERLFNELVYLIFETDLGKNKLYGNKDYFIETEEKTFLLKNKEDCINFLIENNLIKKD